ncbi:hypothetical protein LR48_Vigan632s000500 [Vigna angularis]|uniref:Uncharacterized protein n=1 Tax=Phaseolus angularis TaxID=3914 RepID=A0A0L9TEN5_PHAAN|nr:hypothetical protein LR48_Vigan632s000500 [Vigna angularis]
MSSFEFARVEGRGYADDAVESSSSTNFSIFGPNDDVAINVDFIDEWDRRCKFRLAVAGYGWAPHEDFKGNFLKVVILEAGRSHFYFPDDQPKFPLYWTDSPNKVISWPKSSMTPKELEVISQLSQLPLKASSRTFIGYLGSKALHNRVFDYLSAMDQGKNNTFARMMARNQEEQKKSGEGCFYHPLITPKPTVMQTPPVDLEIQAATSASHPAEAIPISSAQTPKKKKNKRKVAREEKEYSKGMIEEEVSNMAYELAARSRVCMAYAASRRKVAAFVELQALQEKLEATVKSNEELTLRVAKVEKFVVDDKAKAKALLAEARTIARQLQRSNDDLKLDLPCSGERNKELVIERDDLLIERDSLRGKLQKLDDENKFLGEEVINEHVLGFNQVIV